MNFFRHIARHTARLVVALVALSSLAMPAAQAALIGTEAVVAQSAADAQRDELKALLARDEVRAQLEEWGVDAADALARVDRLSPAEVEQMHARMEELPAGGDAIGALVFVFLVLLFTDILGFTDVFPFVNSIDERR